MIILHFWVGAGCLHCLGIVFPCKLLV